MAISDLRVQADGVNRLNSPSLVALAVASIRNGILANAYQAGEHLHEERLTRELDISRPPLREALRLLENEGLVFTRPRHGSFVVTLTDRDVYEILTLRSALERTAFELGIPVRDLSLLGPARDALADMERYARVEDATRSFWRALRSTHASFASPSIAGSKRSTRRCSSRSCSACPATSSQASTSSRASRSRRRATATCSNSSNPATRKLRWPNSQPTASRSSRRRWSDDTRSPAEAEAQP